VVVLSATEAGQAGLPLLTAAAKPNCYVTNEFQAKQL
jgi:hypothetical protein